VHCRHQGAHLGHGGKVSGDSVECPFHAWVRGPDGRNRFIPDSPDRPNRALTLRVFPVKEQHGAVFIWHHPAGDPPRWKMPDTFESFPQFPTDPSTYYRPFPEFSRFTGPEPVNPRWGPRTAPTAPTSATYTARRSPPAC